ncbi:MAG: pitrilysin family protein [Mariprofundales bacterium]
MTNNHNPAVRETTLGKDGPLLCSWNMPSRHTVAIGIFAYVGSRHEESNQEGWAHALEHMLFKGTPEYNPEQLNVLLDEFGGTANAYTSRETTCLHMLTLQEDWQRALPLMCSMMLDASIPEEEWQREREVIYSEIAGSDDSPEEWAYDRHIQALFAGQGLAHPILGSRDSLAATNADMLRGFLQQHYAGERLLIAIAGDIQHDEVLDLLSARQWPTSKQQPEYNGVSLNHGIQTLERDTEQAQIMLSWPGMRKSAANRATAWLFNQIIGGGMSSRLFREVREKRGLAYSVHSDFGSYTDGGTWNISCGTHPKRVAECIKVIKQCIAEQAIDIDELARARRQLLVHLRMGKDSVQGNMRRLTQRFYEPSVRSQDEWAAIIEAISLEEIHSFADNILQQQHYMTLSGPAKAMSGWDS